MEKHVRISRVVRGRVGGGGVEVGDANGSRGIGLFVEAQDEKVLMAQSRPYSRGSQCIREVRQPQAERCW